MVLLQHVAEFRRDTLRADHGGAGAQADDLYMRDLAQARDDVFQFLVAHHQGVATREQHVAYALGLLDIFEGFLDTVGAAFVVGLAGKTTARAVTAVHGAHVGDKEQHAVRITVGQAGRRRVFVLVQRVEQVGGCLMGLQSGRDALTADGVMRVVRVDEAQIIWSDGHTEGREGLSYAFFLFCGQFHIFLQVLKGLDAVLHLPFPVVPLLVGDFREQLFSS